MDFWTFIQFLRKFPALLPTAPWPAPSSQAVGAGTGVPIDLFGNG
jgi:hypothetical protein